jgi:F-type H+-transporting ATPase subunit delta
VANAKQDHIGSAQLVYARALLELADDAGKLDLVVDQVKDLQQLIRQEPDLARMLDSLMLSVEQRQSILNNVFKGQIDDLLLHFMQVVNAKHRLNLLPSILDAFVKLVDQKRGVIEVEAHVAAALDEASAARVAEGIGQALGGRVVLHQKVEPGLIGGIKIRVGDRVIDGSVAAQLRQFRRQLIDTGREQARTGAAIESV